MLRLSGRTIQLHQAPDFPRVGSVRKLYSATDSPPQFQQNAACLLESDLGGDPGFEFYVAIEGISAPNLRMDGNNVVWLPKTFSYLGPGDIVRISNDSNRILVLYRKNSNQNHFLVTEQCDNYCVMCSQPPKAVDDSMIIDEILEALPLVDKGTRELGFTGGEPTLRRDRFLEVLQSCKVHLPITSIHVLSNGRAFSDLKFARAWADLQHPDLMVGIPLYSDLSHEHDYVVQADGAYDETIRGILNLKRFEQKVELRVVLHRHTCWQLPRLAEFIARNLIFVDHVALMGLELMGFARANIHNLWIDPVEYQAELRTATRILSTAGMRVSIYNHQLCVLDKELWPWAVKSISDWKNDYLPECTQCAVRERCGGFFSSTLKKPSKSIRAITADAT